VSLSYRGIADVAGTDLGHAAAFLDHPVRSTNVR
jgi:hypothetical protein